MDRPAARAPECNGSCARCVSDRRARGTRRPSRVPRSDRYECRGDAEAGRSRRAAPVADWPAPIAKRVLCLLCGTAKPGNDAAQWGSPLAWPGGRASQGSRCGGERYRAAGGARPTRTNRVCRPLPMRSRGGRVYCAITFASFSREARVQAFLIDLARFVETRGWLVPRILARPSGLQRRSSSWPARR